MIKRLRKNIIITNMILVGTVILMIFIVVCVNNYSVSVTNIQRGLEQSLERNIDNKNHVPDIIGNKERKELPVMLNSYTIIETDADGNIIKSQENNATISDESLEDAVKIALATNEKGGEIHEYNLMFAKKDFMGKTKIAFADSSSVYSSLWNTILVCFVLFLASLIIIFVISLALSGIAVNPVKDAWNKQKQFVADASHELKTPLTVILANNNIMMSHSESNIENERKWLESTQEEANHMKNLINQMLFLAKSDSDETKTEFSSVNISEIIEADSLNFEPIAFEKNIIISTEITPDIMIQSNHTLLTQLSHILIDNAVKYGYDGTTVTIKLLKKGDNVEFSVNNFGDALSKNELEHIFDRFYRAEKSRTSGGYGLGLSIAKNITKNLNGKISVESNAENGTTFRVQW
ncbi:MAG: HAMP domain-containing sensor histidine kinase [Ruminococcus sp.]|nr:HAMP domain-containing sensor histidine kinase [Ruminococcus sp.]